jgi:hypothetical protein
MLFEGEEGVVPVMTGAAGGVANDTHIDERLYGEFFPFPYPTSQQSSIPRTMYRYFIVLIPFD